MSWKELNRSVDGPGLKSLDIAQAAGYRDPSNFARAFRRIAGVSPREYRLSKRNSGACNKKLE